MCISRSKFFHVMVLLYLFGGCLFVLLAKFLQTFFQGQLHHYWMYNMLKFVTFPNSKKFDFRCIIHLDVHLLWSVIISDIVKLWLVKLWQVASSTPSCLMLGIFIIYVIQCHKGIVLILMCLLRLHKWSIRLHTWLVWFYYDLISDILVLALRMFRCPVPMWVLFRTLLRYSLL